MLCLGLSACAITGPQRPHRTGLWGEIAGGAGRMRMTCSECTDPIQAPGGAAQTRIGGTLSDQVMLGAESAIFTDEAFGATLGDSNAVVAQLETVGVVVLWFPWRAGFFLKGGVSLAQGRFTIDNGALPPDSIEHTGVGMSFGVGWDVPISRRFAITGNAGTYVTAIGDIVLPSRRVDDVIGTMWQFTAGVTFR